VIDLEAQPPPRDRQGRVGDAPEGFAVSPTGTLAVAVLLPARTTRRPSGSTNRNGSVVVLKIDGKRSLNRRGRGARLPEGAVFSPTAAGSTSAISWTATSRCCVSMATPSPIPHAAENCRASRPRCGANAVTNASRRGAPSTRRPHTYSGSNAT